VNKATHILHSLGLHPLTAFGMIAVDLMLFAAEGGTLGTSWLISVAVGVALSIPCILIQRHGYKDTWGLAVGKGIMVGVLTAIPTPLPSIISLAGGVIGTTSMLLGSGKSSEE
jgi:hypothetical protein